MTNPQLTREDFVKGVLACITKIQTGMTTDLAREWAETITAEYYDGQANEYTPQEAVDAELSSA